MPTDKQYTSQQIEPGDTALGLYNYKARFYSTTLGRFLSADSETKDGLNRYAYVGNNPTSAIDPTGLYLLALCGWTQTCDKGDSHASWDSAAWRNLFTQYWKSTGRFGGADLDVVFNLFVGAKLMGIDDAKIVDTFDADILDTAHDRIRFDVDNSARELQAKVDGIYAATGNPLQYIAGFSWGGVTTNEFLYAVYNKRDGFHQRGLDLKGVLYVGAPIIHIDSSPFDFPGVTSLGADGSFNLTARGIRVVARSSPPDFRGRDPFGLGEIRGGLSEDALRPDDAGSATGDGCHHCVWGPSLWWDAHDLFGLTD